ncbi:MAG: type II CAAX endopeptidase family protein [Syntrophomonas sp.]|uniref:CPBP family intramembrane glutamic endopeptidase n=1 Tax=Syntrophomonas sp. TaxID=2053627 RepID=UPI0026338EA0|nr:type II CAAX endopeptidase family protein [Syntrophomonas sp.]MDD2510058.1 type II CAAX endopeptidase family protein [Syntrophomonas sp.]MDD3879010.1 type II CAAX endopeptidase family protein [Syntrophomonas sp.]MDD4626764.1 type II CAAX endopeptidase family protein [Syntrophomonas sp.]
MEGVNGQQLKWNCLEPILVYLGILLSGLLFSFLGEDISFIMLAIGMPQTEMAFFAVAYIFQFLATVLLVLFLSVFANNASLDDLGLNNTSWSNYWQYGILGGLLLMLLVLLLSLPINYLQPDIQPQIIEEMLRSVQGSSEFIMLLVMGAVLAPVSEELFYRGMIYPVVRGYLGPLWGAIVAGLIFGLAHWDFWRTIPLAVGGAVLCYFYEKTGSILVTMLAHGVWNGVMAVFVYFSLINV